jgi:4-alpha-glucanotransferase
MNVIIERFVVSQMLDQCFAGVIIHPTSLPGPYGIGEIGEEAFGLVDWMVSAGLTMWQVW